MRNRFYLAILVWIGLNACQSKEEILQQQYSIEGMNAYQTHCENCHQKDGKGLKDLYPAVMGTDLFERVSDQQLVHLLKYGQKGEIVVNGKKYEGFMPGNGKLEPLDIAEIITYLREKNGNKTLFPLDSARKYLSNK